MMRQYELVERVSRYNPKADEDLLNRAYVYAMKAHGTAVRASGDLYFSHPLEVAAILTHYRADDITIAAALLHDTVEDTDTTLEDILRVFGSQVTALVDGLTKLAKLELTSKKATQAENLRKLLLATATDVRVLLIKLADRLHNMRTLHFTSGEKRKRIAEETLEIYAPLAGRMGMQDMRDELEDLAFCNLHTKGYKMIEDRLRKLEERNIGIVEAIEGELTRMLEKQGIHAVVAGRRKQPYSIWKKMERQSIAFEQLADIYGFRVIVPGVEACYRALGFIHTSWPIVPGRFKDYISTPKSNDYRSIHTTVIGPGHQRIEVQIRTEDMHNIAEYGIAAHTLYKDGSYVQTGPRGELQLNAESQAYRWLRRTVELLSDGSNPEEFLENTKMELFQDQVFCYTPKGQVVALPRGATPIDFAYTVHTDIGNRCVGCKINAQAAPLASELHNGDMVEIITSSTHVPPVAWEQIVATGKARYEIRKATRQAARGKYAVLGTSLLKTALERESLSYSISKLESVLKRLARPNTEEALAAIGRGELAVEDVIKALYPAWDHKKERKPQVQEHEGWIEVSAGQGITFKVPTKDAPGRRRSYYDGSAALPILSFSGDVPVQLAPDTGAVPGDKIVGILTPGEALTIYPIHAAALSSFENEPERWLDVRWEVDPAEGRRFRTRIIANTINEPGSLAQVTGVIAENDGNIDNIRMNRRTPEFTELTIDLEVWDLKHLNAILSELRLRPNVSQVSRVMG